MTQTRLLYGDANLHKREFQVDADLPRCRRRSKCGSNQSPISQPNMNIRPCLDNQHRPKLGLCLYCWRRGPGQLNQLITFFTTYFILFCFKLTIKIHFGLNDLLMSNWTHLQDELSTGRHSTPRIHISSPPGGTHNLCRSLISEAPILWTTNFNLPKQT